MTWQQISDWIQTMQAEERSEQAELVDNDGDEPVFYSVIRDKTVDMTDDEMRSNGTKLLVITSDD